MADELLVHTSGQEKVFHVECAVRLPERPTSQDSGAGLAEHEQGELCGIGLRFTFSAGVSEVMLVSYASVPASCALRVSASNTRHPQMVYNDKIVHTPLPFVSLSHRAFADTRAMRSLQVVEVKPGSPCSMLDIAQGDVLVQVRAHNPHKGRGQSGYMGTHIHTYMHTCKHKSFCPPLRRAPCLASTRKAARG
jgi:hypothetical protein